MPEEKKKHILIIEDEKDLAVMLKEVLEEADFEVSVVGDGIEGLRSIFEKPPDLILLDLNLPKMDGLTLLRKIRENEKRRDLPIVILSNVSDVASISEAMEGKVYDYLIKSDWKLEDVVVKIKKTLHIK